MSASLAAPMLLDFTRMSCTLRFAVTFVIVQTAGRRNSKTPFSQKIGVSSRTLCSFKAAAAVTILKVEPGSIMSMMARFFICSGFASARWFRSKFGRFAIARISPVCGRIRMMVAFLRRVFAHRRVDLVLDDVLQIQVDREVDLVAVTRRAFLPAIKHDLLAGAVVLDVAITILAVQIFFHRRFHALDALVIEIGEPDDVTKHRAVRINARRIALEINAAQILRVQFFARATFAIRLGTSRFKHDVTAIAARVFPRPRRAEVRSVSREQSERALRRSLIRRRVRDDGFDRHVVREHFVVRVDDRAALGEDRLLDRRASPRRARRYSSCLTICR